MEMLFRFQNFETKENILSNYTGIRPNLREEQINLEISHDEQPEEGEKNVKIKPKEKLNKEDSFINDDEDKIENEKMEIEEVKKEPKEDLTT